MGPLLELTDEQWVDHLCRIGNAERDDLEKLSAHYEGKQPLSYMHPDLVRELEDRVKQVIINWPRLVVDSLEERLDVEGFRFEKDASADIDLWKIWQANGLDHGSQQAHLESLIMKRSFAIAGTGEDPAIPRITVESPQQMAAHFDPQTRKVRTAVKRWGETRSTLATIGAAREDYATLYVLGRTVQYGWIKGKWAVIDVDEHGVDKPLVVVFPNRGRLLNPGGVSELADIIPLSDAACKIATDMMVSAEFHAMPRRYALGFDESDFEDETGKPVSTWSKIAGRIWATTKSTQDGAAVGQFPEANLTNFHETLNQLARLVSSLSAMPPHELGFTTDNPASADAIRSAESRRTKRAERRQRAWGEAWEDVMRLALRIRDGAWDENAVSLETMWRDASTPTVAQKADAAVKLHQQGIVPTEQTREDLGYTSAQRTRMAEQDAQAQSDPVLESIARQLTTPAAPVPAVPPAA